MKKKLLFMGLVVACFLSHAQFEVRDKSDDSVVTDGQTVSFSESGSSSSEPYNWKFKVTNTTPADIYMRIFVDNMTNSDGSNYQLCFNGVCLNSISLNSGYPSTPALIASGATNSAGNSFWNQNPSTTTTPMSWVFRFQAFDAGGTEIGTPLSVTYNFDPNLSLEEPEFTNVTIFPTSAKDELTVISGENLSAEFYTILGKKVKEVKTITGSSIINISDLSSQLYIVKFTNEDGQNITKKIIKE